MKRKLALQIAIIVLAIAFILIGIISGEATIVLRKARDICLSCIGIG